MNHFVKDSWLMVTDLDGTLLNKNAQLNLKSKLILEELIDQGALITVATARTCATILPILNGLNLPLPAITMNGSALYDFKRQEFLQCKIIPNRIAKEILSIFRLYKSNCFTHSICNGEINIFFDEFYHHVEKEFYNDRKTLPMKHYYQKDLPSGRDVIYFSAMDVKEKMMQILHAIQTLPSSNQFQATYYSDIYHPGYFFLEIYHHHASKKNAVLSLKKSYANSKVAVFGDNYNDISMMEVADHSYAVRNAVNEVKQIADSIIGLNDEDAVALEMKKLFYGL